jgi:hypothetical protein
MLTNADVRAVILDSTNMRELRERLRALYPQIPIPDRVADDILEAATGGDAPDDPLPPDIARARDHLARLT